MNVLPEDLVLHLSGGRMEGILSHLEGGHEDTSGAVVSHLEMTDPTDNKF